MIRRKGESQNGGNKKTKHTKFSEENKHFLPPDISIVTFSCYLRFEICLFALLLTICKYILTCTIGLNACKKFFLIFTAFE